MPANMITIYDNSQNENLKKKLYLYLKESLYRYYIF